MARGFMCDTCRDLEAGTPPQTLSIKPADATIAQTYELCTNCAASFADWRTDRRGGATDGR